MTDVVERLSFSAGLLHVQEPTIRFYVFSILNPSIVHSNKCRALMNVRAMVRSVSL
jgi:hypothetical protein